MRVLVTGGTGFVGSHLVAALRWTGHDVRVLARSPERLAPLVKRFGVDRVEVAPGDVTDRASVEEALAGVDAVVHAAAIYSLDRRRGEEMLRTNETGSRVVLGRAVAAGLDPVVHLSSMVALMPGRYPLIPDGPLGDSPIAYYRSKAAAERVARALQAEGAPVTIVGPTMVWGPGDPSLGESDRLLRTILTGGLPAVAAGTLQLVDVRDVAHAIAKALRPGLGPRRYLLGGQAIELRDLIRTISRLTGRRLPVFRIPRAAERSLGRVNDALQPFVPKRLPFDYAGIYTHLEGATVDSSRAIGELGFTPRPLEDTLADTIRWLLQTGRIRPRHAGLLREEASTQGARDDAGEAGGSPVSRRWD